MMKHDRNETLGHNELDMDQAHHHHGIGSHSHAPVSFGRAFAIGMVLNAIYILAEVFYGIAAHSLAVWSKY